MAELTFRKLRATAVIIMFFATLLTLNWNTRVSGFSDGVWWGNCSGRYTVWSSALAQGRVTVYGCSNGYYFTNVTSTRNASINARITRTSPYYNNQLVSGYGYAITTNMVARLNGACYSSWGYAGSGNGFSFCYR
jgi:hypothetical protein